MSTFSADALLGHKLVKAGGISLSPWEAFDRAWTALKGYHAEDFRFVPGATPMSTFRETAMMLVLYYVVIFGGRELMRNRPAFKMNGLFLIHNFYLTAISGGLLALFVQQIVPTIWNTGLYNSICGHANGGWTDKLVTLYYLNYLTKYLELLDTVFLVLKKKPLTFLHCYHHGATAYLCYTQLVGHTSVSWVPITLNLMVHVVMYWYYFQSARGIRIWWKEWITRLQIAQFVLDLGFVYFATYDWLIGSTFPDSGLPHVGTCAGEPRAAYTGCAILSSYLMLFISFYLATYKRASGARGASQSTKATKAARDVRAKEVPSFSETSEKAADALRAATSSVLLANSEMPATRTRRT